jgi:hypothetical protein
LNIWIFEYLNIWIFEYLNIWIFEYLNIWIFEYLNIWIFEYLNTQKKYLALELNYGAESKTKVNYLREKLTFNSKTRDAINKPFVEIIGTG